MEKLKLQFLIYIIFYRITDNNYHLDYKINLRPYTILIHYYFERMILKEFLLLFQELNVPKDH